MKIFSEIYGAYYRAAGRLLSKKSATKKDINAVFEEEAFAESFIMASKKLTDENSWGLLLKNNDGSYSPITKHPPSHIVTLLQKRWLKAVLNDRRFRIFMDDPTAERLVRHLDGVTPLWHREIFRYFDVFTDGDSYEDKSYRANFSAILSAVKEREIVAIAFISGKKKSSVGMYLPLKLEYSRKNDKMRVYCLKAADNKFTGMKLINIGRITAVCPTGKRLRKNQLPEEYICRLFAQRRGVPVEVEVSNERNGVERFLMEFADLEKRTELDIKTGRCRVLLYYDEQDETELLIRLLSFGPVIRIISPEAFRRQAVQRVARQYRLWHGDKNE